MVTCAVCCLEKSGLVRKLFCLEADVDVHFQHLGDEVVKDGVVAPDGDVGGNVAESVNYFAGTKLVTTSTITF